MSRYLEHVASHSDIRVETFEVEQVYLTPFTHPDPEDPGAKGYQFVRRRGQKDSFGYTHHRNTPKSGSKSSIHGIPQVLMVSRAISGRDYLALLKQADPDRYVFPFVVALSLFWFPFH